MGKQEIKTGTIEDLAKDMSECGVHQEPSISQKMAFARMKIDNALQEILSDSGLDLYLFDYLITSVQSDIRKAAIDFHLMDGMKVKKEDAERFFGNAEMVNNERG